MRPALEVLGLVRDFGRLRALGGVSLSVPAGERRAVIGPNGAGKTTLFHVISGEVRPTAGRVRVLGRDVTGLPPHAVARLGLARSFQRTNVLAGLTVFENVRLACQAGRAGVWNAFWPAVSYRAAIDAAWAALEEVGLEESAAALAGALPYGARRRLDLAIALAADPAVLLLDEPTAGLSPEETQDLLALLARVPRSRTLLLVEHDMDVVFAVADRVTVLHRGAVLADGPPDAVRADPAVQDAYFGARFARDARWASGGGPG
jgi:branched-chain amino acid transport system ATP-binding protein